MILAMAMMLFQFPAITAAANTPQPVPGRTAVESAVSMPMNDSEHAKPATAIAIAPARSFSAPIPGTQPALAPIVEPPTGFLDAGVYNPPPPDLLDFEEPPVMHAKSWFVLGIAEHSSATFDAWSTRRALNTGRVEADPVMRPFAGSPAIYGAIQVIPLGMDYLARRLQRSSNWTRHIWWAPQSIATATFLFSGSYNTAHTP